MRGTAAWLLALALAAAAGAPARAGERLVVQEGRPETVYDWKRQRCAQWDIPDTPLRAFRDARGQVVAFASDADNRGFTGPDLARLTHRCAKAFEGARDPDPAARSYLSYIAATWTDDGKRVAALVHDEYHAERMPGRCRFSAAMQCWYNVITGAVSNDGGKTFHAARPPALIAGPPFGQDAGQGRHRGFFNPTNIVRLGPSHYFLAHTTGWDGQAAGSCLFRTRDPFDFGSWRGFDGAGFGARAVDPYHAKGSGYAACKPVHSGAVNAIAWHARSQRFVALWMVEKAPDAPRGGVRYAWSRDLIAWEPARTLIALPAFFRSDCGDTERYGYPALLDPEPGARNFDRIGDSPWLYLVRMRVTQCHNGPERDLVRMRLKLEE